ncbi:MAG: thioredoxin [Caldilineales bacterium]|nr:thioredoxin [Caldilineales bacterium]
MSFLKNLFGGRQEAVSLPSHPVPASGEPIHVSDADFERVIMQADRPAIVDLWADWCGPCHRLAPTIAQLAAAYGDRVIVAKLDVDENPRSAARFDVMGIPTVLFIANGAVVDRLVGVQRYEAFANRIEHLLTAEPA